METLPEFDKPAYFGLPENIERSSQRMISGAVVSQLRVLKRADAKASKFDKDVWANELGPLLNLWKKLNTVSLFIAQGTRYTHASLLIVTPEFHRTYFSPSGIQFDPDKNRTAQ